MLVRRLNNILKNYNLLLNYNVIHHRPMDCTEICSLSHICKHCTLRLWLLQTCPYSVAMTPALQKAAGLIFPRRHRHLAFIIT